MSSSSICSVIVLNDTFIAKINEHEEQLIYAKWERTRLENACTPLEQYMYFDSFFNTGLSFPRSG